MGLDKEVFGTIESKSKQSSTGWKSHVLSVIPPGIALIKFKR